VYGQKINGKEFSDGECYCSNGSLRHVTNSNSSSSSSVISGTSNDSNAPRVPAYYDYDSESTVTPTSSVNDFDDLPDSTSADTAQQYHSSSDVTPHSTVSIISSVVAAGGKGRGGVTALFPYFWAVEKLSKNFLLSEDFRQNIQICKIWVSKTPICGKFRGKIKTLSTRNYHCQKFAAVFPGFR